MSRSYREPWVKDHPKGVKALHARRERRIIRQLVKPWRLRYQDMEDFEYDIYLEDDDFYPDFSKVTIHVSSSPEPILPSRKEITNPYNISDFRFPWTKEPKAFRK